MNQDRMIQLLAHIEAEQRLLNKKEEILRTMRSIAMEAIEAGDDRRLVLDRSFQELKQQLAYIETKNVGSFH